MRLLFSRSKPDFSAACKTALTCALLTVTVATGSTCVFWLSIYWSKERLSARLALPFPEEHYP
jgi:hypothetical protein